MTPIVPRYPIYIPSKGRWAPSRRMTALTLEAMRVPYTIVVEAQEADAYTAAVDPAFGAVLVLDPAYQRAYDTCDDLGDSKPKGSGPARNFIWDRARAAGVARHWVIDDNIRYFYRLHRNKKRPLADGTCFRAMEDFVDRYTNVGMAGPHYVFFAAQGQHYPPFQINTRVYSCNLVRTDLPFRWRGRYNEDTILSLDLLKAGWCTVVFYAFLQGKMATQTVRGGNTDSIYVGGTKPKSEMLVREHPDVARLVWRYGRWHHHVNYLPFKALRLRKRPDLVVPGGADDYGLRLVGERMRV